MSKNLPAFFIVGLLVVAAVIGIILYRQRGSHLVPEGSIISVHTVVLDEKSSALVIDFRARNPADYDMIMRTFGVSVVQANGQGTEGMDIAASDLPQMFQYHPELGPLRNAPLHLRTQIAPHKELFGTVAVRFDLPERDLKARRGVSFFLQDVTGLKLELSAK